MDGDVGCADGDVQQAVRQVVALNRWLNADTSTEGDRRRPDPPHPSPRVGVPLPKPQTDLPVSLTDALWARRSHYRFAPQALDLDVLSTLLRLAVGAGRVVEAPDGVERALGLAPSAGGLPSLAVYVVIQRVDGVDPGVYRYEADGHRLEMVTIGDAGPSLARALVQPEFAHRVPVTLVLVGRLDQVLHRYPLRHYRTIHVDAGIAVQNLYLVSTALKLAGCAVSGFRDADLSRLLSLPECEIPLITFMLGEPASGGGEGVGGRHRAP